MSKKYIIKTVDDLFDIPADKLPLCLVELGSAIALLGKLKKPGEALLKQFEWIDDGAYSVEVRYPSGAAKNVCSDWTKLFTESK